MSGPARYRHRQTSRLPHVLTALGALALVVLVVWADSTGIVIGSACVAVVVLVAVGLGSLTTTVDDDAVEVSFTFGWPRRRFDLVRIATVERVRNRPWWGWGIRYVPGGAWMYNVAGLDAVELVTVADRRFRIGTDDPDGLVAAIAVRHPGDRR